MAYWDKRPPTIKEKRELKKSVRPKALICIGPLLQVFSFCPNTVALNQGHFVIPADIFGCHKRVTGNYQDATPG